MDATNGPTTRNEAPGEVPKLSARLGRPLIDRLIDEAACGSRTSTVEEHVIAQVSEHLGDLIALGIVKPHDSLPNRRINTVASWNAMCGGADAGWCDPTTERNRIADTVARMVFLRDVAHLGHSIANERIDAAGREERTRSIEAMMDEGTSALLWSGEDHDFASGERVSIAFVGWNLLVARRTRDCRTALQPIEDHRPAAIHDLEIDVPSGEILVADWFHAPGFTDLVDEGNPWRGGSDEENQSDAERYRDNHGFVSVSTCTRSLTLFGRGDTIGIGHHDEDGEHPKPKGCRRIATLLVDLRKISIVDREVLVEILGKIHPIDRARVMVDEIADRRRTVRLKVRPGRYRVRSNGRGRIDDLLPADHRFATPGFEAVVVIEPVHGTDSVDPNPDSPRR